MTPSSAFSLRSRVSSLLLALFLAFGALGFIPPPPVHASAFDSGAFYVNTYSDDPNATSCSSNAASNNCSLRGAISKANNTSGAVTIYLQSGSYPLFGEPGDDANQGGDLDITKSGASISIIGDSISSTTIDGRGNDRIFDVQDTGAPTRLNLKNLSLANGNAGPFNDGGSIRTYGSLSLDTVSIHNSSGRLGGAIYIRSSDDQALIINRSAISFSSASLDGGAIYATGEVTTISNSTFDHNKATGLMGLYFSNSNAGRGGAIYNASSLSVSASTFAYNSAKVDGGAILNYAFMGINASTHINSSTFKSNSTAVANVATANGNASTSAVTTLSNSILASSTETENCVNKVDDPNHASASFVNAGSNLDTGISCGFLNSAGSIFGQDPRLGDLSDNGGPTDTIPLNDGSPAIDMGNPSSCSMRDQRGLFAVTRCDIGAFEYNASPTLLAAVFGSRGSQRLQVTALNQKGNPLVGWLVTFDPPDGVSIPFSASSARTNDLGVAFITADSSALAGNALVTARSGSATAWFMGSASGFVPYYRDGLPNTGFAPGLLTSLPPQDKPYASQGDLSLFIPRLALSLPVVGIPRDGSSWDISWLSRQAGYLEGTAFPSFAGNSVLTSHVYLADGTPGPFLHLASLIYGDKVQIHAYGSTFTYEVRSVRSVSPDDTSVLGHRDAPWITLLTCQDFDPASHAYLRRVAVSAVLVQSSTP